MIQMGLVHSARLIIAHNQHKINFPSHSRSDFIGFPFTCIVLTASYSLKVLLAKQVGYLVSIPVSTGYFILWIGSFKARWYI